MTETCRLEHSATIWSWLLLLTTAGLVAAGISQSNVNFYLAAIFPFLVCLWLWLTSPRAQELTLGPDALTDEFQDKSIRYDDIVGITISGTTPDADSETVSGGNLAVIDLDHCHEFPRLNANSARQLYCALIERIPESGSRQLSSLLSQRLQNDLNLFDEDLVFTYRARMNEKLPKKRFHTLFLVLILTGILWTVAGSMQRPLEDWAMFGGMMIGIAVVAWLIYAVGSFGSLVQIPNRSLASLIVSPRGIALHQGRMSGEMKWDEMKSIHCGAVPKGTFVNAAAPRAIFIKIDGAQVLIHDIYDRPLATIYRCMQRYWTQG